MTGNARLSILIAGTAAARLDDIGTALLQQSASLEDVEVVLVHAPRAGLRRRAARLAQAGHGGLHLRVIQAPGTSRARALNAAMRASSGGLLLLLADDCVPSPTWIEAHRRLHEARPEGNVVGLGPSVFSEELRRDPFRRGLEDSGAIFGASFTSGSEPAPGFFYTANASIERALLEAAGGFDETSIHDSAQDANLAARLQQLGTEVVFVAEASVRHEHRVSIREHCRRMWDAGRAAATFEARRPSRAPAPPVHEVSARAGVGRAIRSALAWLASPSPQRRERAWRDVQVGAFLIGYTYERRGARASPTSPLSASGDDAPPSWGEVLDGSRRWTALLPRASHGGIEALDIEDGRMLPKDGEAGQPFFNPLGSAQAYFRFRRPHGLANRAIEIEVDVQADASHSIRIDYDSVDHAVRVVPALPGAFKATADQLLSKEARWERLTFRVGDARFCSSLNGGDFRVVSSRRHGPLLLRAVAARAVGSSDTASRPQANGARTVAFASHAAPQVSIVIPVWNRLDITLDCLRALAENTEGRYEVIVVDNGSVPAARAALGSIPGLRLRRHEVNLGFARACNDGARLARGRHLLFLNNDTIPQPGWLPPMLAARDKDPRIGIVGSLLLYSETREVQHAGVDLDSRGVPFHRFRFGAATEPAVVRDGVVPAVTGACLLTTADLFARLGGFDEGFVNGYEDVDLCLRAGKAGRLTYYCSASVLLHHEAATPGRLEPAREAANLARLRRLWPRGSAAQSLS
jgi:GT2 family glycosyltransferase